MPKVLVNDENLTNIANAIREKNGETTTYKPGDMATAIQNISSGGNIPEVGFIVNKFNALGLPTDITIVGLTSLNEYFGFTKDGYGPFKYLKKVQLPSNLTSLGRCSFGYCKNLTTINLPDGITMLDAYSIFEYCASLTLNALPKNLTKIGTSVFRDCTNLALTELPNSITYLGEQAFLGCTNLALTKLPNSITYLGERAFRECTNLALTELPSGITYIREGTFWECTSLTQITCLGDVTYIDGNSSYGSFNGCSNLTKFILHNITAVPTLSGTGAFTSTPIKNGTGYIYVPDALVDSFKSATNWSTYADQIKPLTMLNLRSIKIANDTIETYADRRMPIEVIYNDESTTPYYKEQEGYTLSVSGNATLEGNVLVLTDDAQVGDIITLTITSTYDNNISSTKEIEVIYKDVKISVDLQKTQWVDSGTVADNGNIIYKSSSAYNTNNGKLVAILNIKGYTKVKLYISSNAEAKYDYTEAFAVDTTAVRGEGIFSTKNISVGEYMECAYELDGGQHRIEIMYSKDNGGNQNDDCGYFYIGECS